MMPLLKCVAVLILTFSFFSSLAAQRDNGAGTIGLTLISGRTPATEFQRDYEIGAIGRRDVTSDVSSLYALSVDYSKEISTKFTWNIGLEGGMNSYHFRMLFDEEFVDLSFAQPFTTEFTEYDRAYVAGILGITYAVDLTTRSQLAFKVGIRASYYVPLTTELLIYAPLQSGQSSNIFVSQVYKDTNNQIILSPDLSLDYVLNFPASRFSLLAGANTAFSRKYFMEGTFQLNGDQEILQGRFRKKMIFLNFGLGLMYRLAK